MTWRFVFIISCGKLAIRRITVEIEVNMRFLYFSRVKFPW
jgi:hypothetical protein